MTADKMINDIIKEQKNLDTNLISDGYHTFGELYEHRIALFIALCKKSKYSWKSIYHSDSSQINGWFVMGIGKKKGEQITYHLPISYWNSLESIKILDKAPEWDGHTPADVIKRLLAL